MSEELTLEDIKKAIKLCRTPKNTKTVEYTWGWIELDSAGPKTIKLKKETHDAVLDLFNYDPSKTKAKEITEFEGIPIMRLDLQ